MAQKYKPLRCLLCRTICLNIDRFSEHVRSVHPDTNLVPYEPYENVTRTDDESVLNLADGKT